MSLVKTFGQIGSAHSWNIPDVDKCRQDKCCLDKCQHVKSVQYGPRNLPFKFGQNQASNSWDIADMDKYRWNKCYMDKCLFDNCFRLSRVNG